MDRIFAYNIVLMGNITLITHLFVFRVILIAKLAVKVVLIVLHVDFL